jgi:DNA-binding winged helix-turn-helix (wHTH) protein
VSSGRWLYDPVEDRLFVQSDGQRHEVSLSPQQHRLVAYMAARNRAEAGRPVLCERKELIAAVWAHESDHGPQDLAYLVHQLRGRVDGNRGAPELIVNERGRGYRLLATAVLAKSPHTQPLSSHPRRRLLIAALALAVIAAGGATLTSLSRSEPVLREGSRGQDVIALQRDLTELGFDPVYIDGQYGPLTAHAVRAFQQANGLVVDGEVGPETRGALHQAVERHRVTADVR